MSLAEIFYGFCVVVVPMLLVVSFAFLTSRIPIVGIVACLCAALLYKYFIDVVVRYYEFLDHDVSSDEASIYLTFIYVGILSTGLILSLDRMWPWKEWMFPKRRVRGINHE